MEPYILYLNLFVLINLIIIALAIGLKKNSHFANICLILVILTCIDTCYNNLALQYFPNRFCHFTQMAFIGFNFCFGCVISAYVTLLYDKKLSKYWLLHLLPCVLVIGYSFRSFGVSDQTITEELALMQKSEFMPLYITNNVMLLHILFYLIFAKIKLNGFRKEPNLSQEVSAKLKRKWAKDFLNYMTLNTVLLITSIIIAQAVFNKTAYFCDLVLVPIVSISIYGFIVYKNIQFSDVYEKVVHEKVLIAKNFEVIKKDNAPTIIPNQEALMKKLHTLMVDKKLFTNPSLTLEKLAIELAISPTILSKLLNQEYQTTFFEFVNQHKIEESKKLLLDPELQHYKIEAIGEMAGFSSRSSFFAVFKKSTGLSPSNYKSL
jgi:AraC-like DNA-binding protein